MLRIEGVHAGYGQMDVLHGIDLSIESGEHLGLFGPNGHGKTTLLRTISGLVRVKAGLISFNGVELVGRNPRGIVDLGVIHVPQGSPTFPDMTILDNLRVGAYTPRVSRDRDRNLARVFDLFPRLAERRSQLARTLSGGERQMLAIGIGLMGNPALLMLDEPTNGLSPLVKETLATAIAQIAAGGVSLLVVDENPEFLLALVNHLALLERGRIALKTSAGAVLDDQHVFSMYFGARAQ